MPSGAQPVDAHAGLLEGEEFAVRVGNTTAHFRHLRIRQLQFAHMLYIIEQSTGGCVLFVSRQLLDFSQRLFEEFCHGMNMPQIGA